MDVRHRLEIFDKISSRGRLVAEQSLAQDAAMRFLHRNAVRGGAATEAAHHGGFEVANDQLQHELTDDINDSIRQVRERTSITIQSENCGAAGVFAADLKFRSRAWSVRRA